MCVVRKARFPVGQVEPLRGATVRAESHSRRAPRAAVLLGPLCSSGRCRNSRFHWPRFLRSVWCELVLFLLLLVLL